MRLRKNLQVTRAIANTSRETLHPVGSPAVLAATGSDDALRLHRDLLHRLQRPAPADDTDLLTQITVTRIRYTPPCAARGLADERAAAVSNPVVTSRRELTPSARRPPAGAGGAEIPGRKRLTPGARRRPGRRRGGEKVLVCGAVGTG
ncbi:hypothetical protein GCM10010207_80180 [Streptomyces atratus]|nr:hypothetical protein GCM10010207_80180 [Streptomyces atratus]